MATTKDFTHYILDSTHSTKTRVKSMFGEYALYYEEKVVALICNNILFVKISENNKKLLGKNKTGRAYPSSKNFYIITEEQICTPKFLQTIFKNVSTSLPKKMLKSNLQ